MLALLVTPPQPVNLLALLHGSPPTPIMVLTKVLTQLATVQMLVIAFSQARFDGVMQSIWEEGGKPDTVYLSAFQMNVALGFTGNNNQRSTPWGSVEFMPSRENRSRDIFIMQDDMWEIASLRGTKNVALAKTGDNTTRQVVTELTLCAKNEAANGGIFDNTTS